MGHGVLEAEKSMGVWPGPIEVVEFRFGSREPTRDCLFGLLSGGGKAVYLAPELRLFICFDAAEGSIVVDDFELKPSGCRGGGGEDERTTGTV